MVLQVIIIGLLIIIILQLREILGKFPKKDYVKEAMERDKKRREQD